MIKQDYFDNQWKVFMLQRDYNCGISQGKWAEFRNLYEIKGNVIRVFSNIQK